MGKSRPAQQPSPSDTEDTELPASDDELEPLDEDLSQPEEDDQESDLHERSETYFEGPAVWEDVDPEELERIAVTVSRNAIPSSENAEVASRLAMQAAALEADNQDPLGLGRIDTRNLLLVRADKGAQQRGARPQMRSGLAGDALARRNFFNRRTTADKADLGGTHKSPAAARNAGNLAHLRNKVLPTNDHFDPEVYLGLVHGETSSQDLKAGRLHLKSELSERTGQLKALVKENFDRFISCKNTIDDIHLRLRKAEGEEGDNIRGDSGASTSDMAECVLEVQEEARHAFGSMLERAAMSERIKSVVSLLKRYESLFRLPTRIRQETERGEYEQVISEYKKARALMADVASMSKEGIWHNLFLEVEKGVEQMTGILTGILRNPHTVPADAVEAVRYLLQLQADGARCAQLVNPVRLWLHTQNDSIHALLDTCSEEHAARLRVIHERGQDQAAAEERWKALQSDNNAQGTVDLDMLLHHKKHGAPSGEATSDAGGTPTSALEPDAAVEQLWLKFVSRLVGVLVRHLPEFWHTPQERLLPLAGISAAAKAAINDGAEDAATMVDCIMDEFRQRIVSALAELSAEGLGKGALQAAVSEIVTGSISLQQAHGPPVIESTCQQVIREACSLCLSQLASERGAAMGKLGELEDWEIVASSHKAGAPVSKMPGVLRDMVSRGMDDVKAIVAEGQRAGVNATAGISAASLRVIFFDSFTVFAVATDKLANAVANEQAAGKDDKDSKVSADAKLLVLLSNCVYMRTQVMLNLALRYSTLLTADGGSDECRELCAECGEDIKQVEGRLVSVFIDSKANVLNDVLEEYFFEDGTDWAAAPAPVALRDAAVELVDALVGVEAEVYLSAPAIRQRVMLELLEHALAAFNHVLVEQLKVVSLGGLLQLLVELHHMETALAGVVKPPVDEMFATARDILLHRIETATQAGSESEEAEQAAAVLDQWAGPGPAGRLEERILAKSKALMGLVLAESKLNVLCFRGA
ncbi:hypothetical protein WJX72_008970 [[Myrmecia] bisecta]|uniref:Exocyst complex component SEC5 n=1 Tax=[Myrmecia] bisecta TaxID=41462 RepID=A0AAW1Q2B4_9CHLO